MSSEEDEERGWIEPEGYVCPDCIDDEFLKKVICTNTCQQKCDYCDNENAAPVTDLMKSIYDTALWRYCFFVDAGSPYDNENTDWLTDSIDTEEMLKQLPLKCKPLLLKNISEAFTTQKWAKPKYGLWDGSQHYDSWDKFSYIVKHQSRYFFQQSTQNLIDQKKYRILPKNYNPAHFLPTLEALIKRHELLYPLPANTTLFRARTKIAGESFDLDAKQLGAPPSKIAGEGRMNPAGISYFYLAFEEETALAEVKSQLFPQTAMGEFEIQRELLILDLTNLPKKPSIFNENCRKKLDEILFLDKFVAEITKPVKKDGSEHIDYVPSQVVSEYFALVFKSNDNKPLDGIKYPSVARPGSYNLVLFPTKRSNELLFNQIEFKTGRIVDTKSAGARCRLWSCISHLWLWCCPVLGNKGKSSRVRR